MRDPSRLRLEVAVVNQLGEEYGLAAALSTLSSVNAQGVIPRTSGLGKARRLTNSGNNLMDDTHPRSVPWSKLPLDAFEFHQRAPLQGGLRTDSTPSFDSLR